MKPARIAGVALAAALAMPSVAAQESEHQLPRVVPMLPVTHPSPARVTGKREIDIPQTAKDEGHNGGAAWTVEVGADGRATSLDLKRSSNSPAIDAAVKAWAESAYYLPATDASGNKVEGQVDVYIKYEPWDRAGLDAYRCSELVRDATWFAAANSTGRGIFALENFYTSLESLKAMTAGEFPTRAEREASRAKALVEWRKLLARCRNRPERPFLDFVEDAGFYRGVVDSF